MNDSKPITTTCHLSENANLPDSLHNQDDQFLNESLEPFTNIQDIFLFFDNKYFWSSLRSTVQVQWAKKLFMNAGMCCKMSDGSILIRLSIPLLKLRPKKDIYATLLHEMIHAYMFLMDHGDAQCHGVEFKGHMHRINKDSGFRITVQHKFFKEVSQYQKHLWVCDGQCRQMPPHFGVVKRAKNRHPRRDFWFVNHQEVCDGTFRKVKNVKEFIAEEKKELKRSFNEMRREMVLSCGLEKFLGNCQNKNDAFTTPLKKITESIVAIEDLKTVDQFKSNSESEDGFWETPSIVLNSCYWNFYERNVQSPNSSDSYAEMMSAMSELNVGCDLNQSE